MAKQLLAQVGKILKRCKDTGVVMARKMKVIVRKMKSVSLKRKLATPDSDTRPSEAPQSHSGPSIEHHTTENAVQSATARERKRAKIVATDEASFIGPDTGSKEVQLVQQEDEDGDIDSSISLDSKQNTRADIKDTISEVDEKFKTSPSVTADNDPSTNSTLSSMRVNNSSEALGSSSEHYVQPNNLIAHRTQPDNLIEDYAQPDSLLYSNSAPPPTWLTTISSAQTGPSPAAHQQLQIQTSDLHRTSDELHPSSVATGPTDHNNSSHGSPHDLSAIGSRFSADPFENDRVDE